MPGAHKVAAAAPGLIWSGLVVLMAVPVALAAVSPQLAWRDPVYIVAGFAGIIGLALLLVQPVLAAGRVAGLRPAWRAGCIAGLGCCWCWRSLCMSVRFG